MTSFGQGRPAPIPHHGGLALAPHHALTYHADTLNYCPGCSGTHWLIGRTMAQCARCETALPLAQMAETPVHPLFVSRSSTTA
jgi:hypothetical protein